MSRFRLPFSLESITSIFSRPKPAPSAERDPATPT